MTAGRLILDDGESTHHRRGDGSPVVLPHAGGRGGAAHPVGLDRPDGFDRALPRFPSASR